jgi:anti-sigma regulatory factor (Ser/Thr protein kinase)
MLLRQLAVERKDRAGNGSSVVARGLLKGSQRPASARAEGLRPGGFGLVLIRAIGDELIYNERQNEVVFIKYLAEPDGAPSEGR